LRLVLMPVSSALHQVLRGIRVGWKVMGMAIAATSVPACWVRPPIPAFGDLVPIRVHLRRDWFRTGGGPRDVPSAAPRGVRCAAPPGDSLRASARSFSGDCASDGAAVSQRQRSTRLQRPGPRAVLLGVGCAVLVGTLVWVATFPISISI
jgi:hypothetical protein